MLKLLALQYARLYLQRTNSIILLTSSEANSNNSAIKFEQDCSVLRSIKSNLSYCVIQIEPLGERKHTLQWVLAPELSERKTIVCCSASNTFVNRKFIYNTLTFKAPSVGWISRAFSLKKQELCAQLWLHGPIYRTLKGNLLNYLNPFSQFFPVSIL